MSDLTRDVVDFSIQVDGACADHTVIVSPKTFELLQTTDVLLSVRDFRVKANWRNQADGYDA